MAVRTEIKKKILLWKIENISFWDLVLHSDEIACPVFQFFDKDEIEWQFILYPQVASRKGICISTSMGTFAKKATNLSINFLWSLLGRDEDWHYPECSCWGKIVNEIRDPGCPTYDDIFKTYKDCYLPNDTMTVRVIFWDGIEPFTRFEQILALTRFNVAQEYFLWRIKEFSFFKINEEVSTVLLMDFPNKRQDFKLKFYLKGSLVEDSTLDFEISAEDPSEQCLKLMISVADNKQKFVKRLERRMIFSPSTPVHGFEFLSRREVLERKSEFLSDGELTLFCHFRSVFKETENYITSVTSDYFTGDVTVIPKNTGAVQNDCKETKLIDTDLKCVVSTLAEGIWQTSVQISDQQSISPQQELNSVANLMEKINRIQYEDEDFKLRSEGVTIPVHKAVLSVRSPVFKRLFCCDMKDSTSDVLDIPDLDVHCLRRLLRFLYTGRIDRELKWESAANLYYAAVKYQVPTLKMKCVSVLKSTLTVSNVGKMLELADRHSDQELMSSLHDFFVRHFDEVFFSEELKKYMERNAILGVKIMSDLYKRKRLLEEIALVVNEIEPLE